MRELLKQIEATEKEMHRAEEQADYWLEDKHFDEVRAGQCEAEADKIYKKLYALTEKAAEKIIGMTFGRIDKKTALAMVNEKRADLKRLFA